MPVCGQCQREAVAGAATCVACGASLGGSAARGTPDPLTGRTLRGVYLVQERIAQGVTGAVYKALHTALEAPFAVKVLTQELHPDAAVVARFRREARAVSRLRHPNIVAVTDFGQTEDGTLYMVMEYVAGRSLARAIADEAPMPEHRAIRIAAQILAALAEAHARQVLHGALSPKDVMLESRRDPPDSVKVLDFGVASIHHATVTSSGSTRSSLTSSVAAYLSPEQLAGGDLDARSDLYSVGAVLFELLTKTLPYPPGAPPGPPPSPGARLGRPVSPDLEAVLLRALSQRPYERPETAADMRDELLRCASAREPPPDAEELGPTVVLPRGPAASPSPAAQPQPQAEEVPLESATLTPPPARPPTPRPAPPRSPTPRATQATSAATAQRRTTRATAATRPTSTQQGTQRRSASARGSGIRPDVLHEVERKALPILGPVAPFLVAKAGAVAGSLEELCDIVASFIPSEPDRAAFLAAVGGARSTPLQGRDRATRSTVRWDPALLDRARSALAAQLGPVARVLVQRASAAARSPQQLCELLEREIRDDAGRAAFRRALGPL